MTTVPQRRSSGRAGTVKLVAAILSVPLLLGASATEQAKSAPTPSAPATTNAAAPGSAPLPTPTQAERAHADDPPEERESSGRAIADAITELDIERARELLKDAPDAPGLAYQRARLAVYVGDCDSADAILSTLPESPEVLRLARLSSNCARATAGSVIVDDKSEGVWVRIQDARDEVLIPTIVEVAARARKTMIEDLGVELPKPLRIDLVRDLFSLASLTGLPVEAAETTGTVAVARWGRVTMISPRAARFGYPWQDTLAHEITHLALTRGSRDYAPLWLQEGIAKREETRWREARPFDDARDPHQIARTALLDGTSVGIDRIGPSIAMLPSPAAAAISYAEVESFMDYWINTLGREAFTLLLLDLKGLNTRDTDKALRSVTGYPLSYWIALWQDHLRELPERVEPEEVETQESERPAVQSVRLGDLLSQQSHVPPTADYYDDALKSAPDKPAVRFRAAATQVALGRKEDAKERLGSLTRIQGLYGSWLGLHGMLLQSVQNANEAEKVFNLGIAVDPLGQEAACEGVSRRTARIPDGGAFSEVDRPHENLPLPGDPMRRKLCQEARAIGRD